MEQVNDKLNLPWVTFKLAGQDYAINSEFVVSIGQTPEEITQVAYANQYIRGITEFRDEVIPLADMRLFLGIRSKEEEFSEFQAMLEQRKQDHIHWVEELRKSVQEEVPFTLATDPHKCAFGRWYDSYETNSSALRYHLDKIDEPHKALHACAIEVEKCTKECKTCKRGECLKRPLERAMQNYMPVVVSLIEEAKQLFYNDIREMSIILQDGQQTAGIIVDEVVGVESLEFIKGDGQGAQISEAHGQIDGVARGEEENKIVLVMNGRNMIRMVNQDSNVSLIAEQQQEQLAFE